MLYHKFTHGFVRQVFNDAGELLEQSFTAGDPVEFETEDGDPINSADMPDKSYHPFDMKGPQDV